MAEIAQTGSAEPGLLTAVGVGPGDPELLTLKGVRVLKDADVILTPVGDRSDSSIALSIVEAHIDRSRQEVLTRVFPMRQPAAEMAAAWQDIAAEIAELVRQGKRVAFVTLGDPMFYSTYLYLQDELQSAYPDVPIATVPGISSILAAAGKSGVALGLGDDILTVVPATLTDAQIGAAIDLAGTFVLLKVYRSFDRLRTLLQEAGLEKNAVYIKRLGLPGEKVIHDLANVAEDDLDYLSLVLVRREKMDV
ncbi:MAG: precorrin-2 C(20)-methyltransferase [Desulfuromonas sp.]|nr:MAG: precorrin-2 C(20)-methyltransferase [Desulfuromonas sp.]